MGYPSFTETVAPDIEELDTVPPSEDVEYPCRVCGREAGPYVGRGPKPKLCVNHKSTSTKTSRVARVTGKDANLAAQATGVLVQLNGIIAMGLMAMGLNGTASAIAGANGQFEEAANQALLTDPELCKLILRGGVKSAKISLGLAYVPILVQAGPMAAMELRELKEKRAARKAEME
jgi:hypothetical protein